QEWQMQKAQNYSGPYSQFRIQNKHLFMFPAPQAGLTVAFEYGSRFWCESSTGTAKETWTVDSDVGRLDEDLMTMGVVWRWLQRHGLDYGEAFRAYEMEVANAIGRDGSPKVINMGEPDLPPRGINVPD